MGLALALLLPLGSAAAESVAVLGVSDPPGPSPELAALTGQLRAAVAAHHPGVLDAARLRERMVGGAPAATLEELDRAYAGALAAHAAGDFEGALRTLRQVVADLEALPAGPEPHAPWTRAMLRLARAEQAVGRRAEALAALGRLLRAAPETAVDGRQFPPSFQKLVEESRAQVKASGTRRLQVEAEAGVRVFVEGREVGEAPVALDLPPGRYRISGLRDGVRVAAVVADLAADDAAVHLDVSLAEALRPEGGPGLSLPAGDRGARLIACSGRLQVDRVVAASLQREGEARFLSATVHDVRRGSQEREGKLRLRDGQAPPGGLDALAVFLVTGRPSALLDVPPDLALPPAAGGTSLALGQPPATARDTWHGPAATSTLVAGVVLGGVALWQGSRASSLYGDARGMTESDPDYTVSRYNAAVRGGDRAKGVAIASGVGAGVSLAATAVIGYLGWKQTGELGLFRF